jgi:AsmA protein
MKGHKRVLAIDGPVRLSVFPRSPSRVSKARLSEAGRTDTFASLDEAGLAVDVLPLPARRAGGRPHPGQGRAGHLRARRTGAQQHRRPPQAAGAGVRQGPRLRRATGGGTMRFGIAGVELADVRARVKDDLAHVDGEVLLQTLSAGRLADKATAPLKLAAHFDFKQPAVKGDLAGDTRLTLDTATGSAALRGMNLRFKGEVPGASALDVALQGSIAWDGARKGVDAEDLKLQFAGNAAGMKLADSRLAIDRFAFDPARKALTLKQLQARIQGTQGNQPAHARARLARAGGGRRQARRQRLQRQDDPRRRAAAHGHLQEHGARRQLRRRAPARLRRAMGQQCTAAQARRHAARRPHAEAGRAVAGPRQARRAGTHRRAEAAAYAVVLRGSAVGSAKRSSWNVQGQLNQSPFTSEGSVMMADVTPQVHAKAHFEALDLNRLLGPDAPAGPGKPATTPATDAPVDMAALRSVDGQFSLRATRFAYRQYRIDDAAIDAALEGGMLRVTQLAGRAWGGQLGLTAFADARASRVAVKGAATGVNVNALVKDVAAKDWIEGTGRVTVDLDTAGRTVHEMKSRLKGTAALQVRDGAVKGINLAKTLRQAKSALSMKQDLGADGEPGPRRPTFSASCSPPFQSRRRRGRRSRDLDHEEPVPAPWGPRRRDRSRPRPHRLRRLRANVTSHRQGADGGGTSAR